MCCTVPTWIAVTWHYMEVRIAVTLRIFMVLHGESNIEQASPQWQTTKAQTNLSCTATASWCKMWCSCNCCCGKCNCIQGPCAYQLRITVTTSQGGKPPGPSPPPSQSPPSDGCTARVVRQVAARNLTTACACQPHGVLRIGPLDLLSQDST